MEIAVKKLIRFRHSLVVIMRGVSLGESRHCENISDLAYADNVEACRGELVEHSILGRKKREIAAILGALEIGRRADEGARDNAAYAVFSGEHLTRGATDSVKLVYGHDLLVCRNLKYAVGGGVDDQLACLDVLFSVVADNVGARVGQIAKCAATYLCLKGIEKLARESVREGGHRRLGYNSCHLPMSCGRVFAFTALFETGIGSLGVFDLSNGIYAINVAESE